MSGHSHWATIKHKKARTDAKRGQSFSKLSKLIMVAAKHGGGDPDANFKLRLAIDKAKAEGLPRDNIERCIKRATGEAGGSTFEELVYEAYGPGGVAFLIESITDNKNRTTPEVRKTLESRGGNLAAKGATARFFEKKGVIAIAKDAIGEDELMELVLEAGADDVKTSDDGYEVTSAPGAFEAVKKAVEGKGITPAMAEVTVMPNTTVPLAQGRETERILELVALLEELEDVNGVFTNLDAGSA